MFTTKRSLQVQMVKTPKNVTPTETTECKHFDIDKINTLVMENGKKLAVALVAAYAIIKVLDTASEIAINAAPKN